MTTEMQTCYRHDDRRAGVRCQRCDRPICPDCMSQASVGFHCPECTRNGAQKVYTARSLVTRPVVTMALVAANVLTYFVTASTANGVRSIDGVLFEPFVAGGDWWRIISSGFLHANLLHIAFNMWALWILGSMLEPVAGRFRFAAIYAAGLTGGSFGVILLSNAQPTVGASGAVFGLMGAAIAAQRARGVNPWDTGLGGLLMINLIFTFAVPGISIGGHLGGLFGGFLAGTLYWDIGPRFPSRHVADVMASSLAVGLGVVAVALATTAG